MYADRISMKNFREQIDKGKILLLPFGATEEHGAHLPLGTDTIQIMRIIERAMTKQDFITAPAVSYGLCSSTRNFPGTITISFGLLEKLAYELLSELDRNGVPKVIVISGHAGSDHMTALRVAAKKIVREKPIKVVVASIADLVLSGQSADFLKSFPPGDKHAGFVETSLMKHLEPELVSDDKIPPPSNPQFPDPLIIPDAQDYFPSGVMGDATGANSEKGKEIFDIAVESLVKLIKWFEDEINY